VSLRQVTETFLDNYKEILEIKGIRVEVIATSEAIVEMNDVLADILVSNILSNAVRYNIDNGYIKCRIDDLSLIVVNSGLPLKTDPELLFRRFHKGSDNVNSVGLGLSIIKKISDNYGMQITYICSGNVHEMKLNYRKNLIPG
jgi:signal transduction histidine kinase